MTSNRLWRTCLIASACCILTLRAQPLERKYAASDGSVIITPAQPAQERSDDGDHHGIAAPEASFDIMHLDDGLTDEERARLDIEDLERDSNDNNESEAEAEQRQDYGKVVESLTGSLGKQQSKKQYRNQQLQQQQLVASYAF